MNRAYRALLTLAVAAAWIGCGRTTTVTSPEGEEATVSESGGEVQITVQGEDGGTVKFAANQAGVALPKDFPKDVPIYPEATVIANAAGQKMRNVTLQSADSAREVKAFYAERLPQNGWEIETSLDTAQGAMLTAKKQQQRLMAMISTRNTRTIVVLTVGEEGK